jgi:1-acyl-sn-glycerol-3-phosphate acyltransferase
MIDAVVRSATSATSATSAASATRTSGGRRRTAARPGPRDDRTTGGADADVDRDRGDAGADRATGATVSLLPVATRVRSQGPDHDPRRGDVDEWGRSEQMRALVRRLYDPMYRRWFRVEWEGLEKIPTEGGALLVANHAGAIPADAPAIMHGIETELHRPVYGLADTFFRTVPVVGTLWSRTGGVPALPDNAYRLLHDQQQLALVFPEGTKATSKAYTDRYRLRRFGRGGFVEIAMRAGVPIVPIAVVGAEESMPIVFRLPAVAKALGLPYFPVTANLLAFGPLGLVTYFPAKFKLRVLDPVHFDVEPGAERYSRSRVMDESEAIRARLQDTLHDMLRARRSVWFG